MNPFYRAIARAISDASGRAFELQSISHLGGGCINETVKLTGRDGTNWFLKSNTGADTAAFAAEFDGLKALAAAGSIRVPAPLIYGSDEGQAWIALEYLPLVEVRRASQEQLGGRLAELHRHPQSYFGWHRDNTIGATTQLNPRSDDWVAFWREHRLGFQFSLAARGGSRFDGTEELLARLGELFAGYQPRPSLLHGDLWSGNVGSLADGSSVVFDPACYFGDREAEFGIVVMFGGFTADFFRGYNRVWPLDAGFKRRLPLYELYHTLNHFNLFGAGYADRCQQLMTGLVAELDKSPAE